MARAETPEQTEKRTRGWPVKKLCLTFTEADGAELALQNEGFKTVRINWSGHHLEVRAKRMTALEAERAFFGDALGRD